MLSGEELSWWKRGHIFYCVLAACVGFDFSPEEHLNCARKIITVRKISTKVFSN